MGQKTTFYVNVPQAVLNFWTRSLRVLDIWMNLHFMIILIPTKGLFVKLPSIAPSWQGGTSI
jgi:hypothetical protein